MDDSAYGAQTSSYSTRRPTVSRRPGEASRQPLTRPSDVEAGPPPRLGGGVQFDGAAGAGTGTSGATGLNRKRTLVRPERQRVDPTHRNYHYLQHTQQQNMPVYASTTGNQANVELDEWDDYDYQQEGQYYGTSYGPESPGASPGQSPRHSPPQPEIARGKSILGREAPQQRTPLKPEQALQPVPTRLTKSKSVRRARKREQEQVQREMTPWVLYCRLLTCCIPNALLRCFGIPNSMQQQAWREKIGLISLILLLGATVGFLTFGFTQAVCSTPAISFTVGQITNGYLVIHGRAYDLTQSSHPAAIGIPAGTNVLYPPVNAGGYDASFMFQNVNSQCFGLITATANSDILQDSNGNLGWYFPCNLFNPDGSTAPNETVGPYNGYACHTMTAARQAYYNLVVTGEVLYDWEALQNSSRNLVSYSGYITTFSTVLIVGMSWISIYWHGWTPPKSTIPRSLTTSAMDLSTHKSAART